MTSSSSTSSLKPATLPQLEALLYQLKKSSQDNSTQGITQFEQHIKKLTAMMHQLKGNQLSVDEQRRLKELEPKITELITTFSATKNTLHEQLGSVASRRKAIRGYGSAQKGNK